MTRRIALFAAFATAALFGAEASAQSSALTPPRFSGFTQGSNPASVEYTRTGVDPMPLPAMITVTAMGSFEISEPSYLLPAAPTGPFDDAVLTLTAMSNTAAESTALGTTTFSQQLGFSGSFTITSGMTTLLSGSFTDSGSLTQVVQNGQPAPVDFTIASATFSSDIFGPLFDEEFKLQFSGGTPVLSVSNGAFQNFGADAADGSFNANVIPEPATLAMAGLGVIALPVALRVARRRRSGSSN